METDRRLATNARDRNAPVTTAMLVDSPLHIPSTAEKGDCVTPGVGRAGESQSWGPRLAPSALALADSRRPRQPPKASSVGAWKVHT